VFFRTDISPAKATCEGAVIFFKHGKTFAKNMGRVFLFAFISLILIGGVIGGIIYLILWTQQGNLAGVYADILHYITEAGASADVLNYINATTIPIIFAAICGISAWGFIHSTFIKPLVLVGVLRNYIESGKNDIPDESGFSILDGKSPKFRKLHEEI